jgi:hypothetical protein
MKIRRRAQGHHLAEAEKVRRGASARAVVPVPKWTAKTSALAQLLFQSLVSACRSSADLLTPTCLAPPSVPLRASFSRSVHCYYHLTNYISFMKWDGLLSLFMPKHQHSFHPRVFLPLKKKERRVLSLLPLPRACPCTSSCGPSNVTVDTPDRSMPPRCTDCTPGGCRPWTRSCRSTSRRADWIHSWCQY